MQKITKGASILGMFILAALVERWVSIKFKPIVSTADLSEGAYIDWSKIPFNSKGLQEVLIQFRDGLSLTSHKITTLQDNLDQLIPGLVPLLLTFFCMWLLRCKVPAIVIILGLFIVGILGHVIGLL